MDYSELLKKIRESLLLSQVQLAKLLGVSFPTVNRIENEHNEPSLKTKRAIRDLWKKHHINSNESKRTEKR